MSREEWAITAVLGVTVVLTFGIGLLRAYADAINDPLFPDDEPVRPKDAEAEPSLWI